MNWYTLKEASEWLAQRGVILRPDSLRQYIVDERYKPKLKATRSYKGFRISEKELEAWAATRKERIIEVGGWRRGRRR